MSQLGLCRTIFDELPLIHKDPTSNHPFVECEALASNLSETSMLSKLMIVSQS